MSILRSDGHQSTVKMHISFVNPDIMKKAAIQALQLLSTMTNG